MECVGIGDLHLTDVEGRGGLSNYIEKSDFYVMSEVSRVVKWAIEHHLSTVVFYGDVCESPRMSYEGQIAFRQLIVRYPQIQFVVYLGNHDKQARESDVGHSLQLIQLFNLPNLKIIVTDTIIKIDGQKVKVCPWPSTDFDARMLNFGHVEVYKSKTDTGRAMEDEKLSKSKAVVCMGHLHTPHRVRNTYYSGTLYQTNFGEPLPKGFHHIKWNSADDYEIIDVPFVPRYKLHNCVIETEEDVAALPDSKFDLIKLVVKDGADVTVPERSNIVMTKVFKTKSDLVSILTEDLTAGAELDFKTSDFFTQWLTEQSVPLSLKKRARALRKEILYGRR